jgi:hypothetical protein
MLLVQKIYASPQCTIFGATDKQIFLRDANQTKLSNENNCKDVNRKQEQKQKQMAA